MLFVLVQNPSLDSPSPKERQAAIEQMATLGNHDAVAKLGAALKKEPKSETRAEIVAALGRIRDKDAIPILADTLRTDLDKDVRSQAIDSLLRMYILLEDTGQVRTIFNKVKSVLIQPNAPVVGPEVQVDMATKEALAAAMQKDFSDEVREEAARALGSLRAKDQIPAMIAALQDPQNREHRAVRAEIVRTLGAMRDPSAGPALERALLDPDKAVVSEAIVAVGLVGDTAARPTLEDMFKNNSSPAIKSRALESLALLRDPASTALFESLMDSKDDNYRELAAEGLARLKYPGAKDWRQRYEQEKKANVQNALAYGLAAAGNLDYMNNLAQALDTRQAFQVEVYLFELGKFDGDLNELYRYLKSANPKVRAGIARIIGNIGDPSSADQIRALNNDPNTDVVRESVAALRKLSR
ncbi:MAG TPA: HEAT repeat domain-containing protein [Terriglobia bacterium]